MIRSTLKKLEAAADRHFRRLVPVALLANVALALFIVAYVPYTEIDWVAYMQEVAGVVEEGELDYRQLRGDTGPLVYPAGFVYIYTVLYYATDRGRNITRAQYIFAVLHTLLVAVVVYIYRKCYRKVDGSALFPLFIVTLLFASRRAMSLFVLRMFNDGVQMLLMYLAVALFVNQSWSLGCLVYSLSVSVKMNALLFAPGLAVLLCQARGPLGALWRVVLFCGVPQVMLGAPFLLHAPTSYLAKAFEMTRVFMYKWSVNGAFLSEERFLDKRVATALVVGHIFTLLAFGHLKWTEEGSFGLFGLIGVRGGKGMQLTLRLNRFSRRLSAQHIVVVLFTSNFIGIVFARTLHYQFYLWYVHTLPMLVWMTNLPVVFKLVLPFVVEVVFNVYPPTALAAVALHVCHIVILGGLASLPRFARVSDPKKQE